MTRERIVFLALFVLTVVGLGSYYWRTGTGPNQGYYEIKPNGATAAVEAKNAKERLAKQDARVLSSPMRTLGLWLGGFFTLAVLSFLYRDNPFYKIAENVFVGVSAAYWMTTGFWNAIVRNLLGSLFPSALKFSVEPGLGLDNIAEDLRGRWYFNWLIDYESAAGDGFRAAWWQLMDWTSWVPMVLGIMLLWRLAPKGQWIARWPLAFIIGITAGIRLIGYLKADFIRQIDSTILPVYAPKYQYNSSALDIGWTIQASLTNILIILGVLCGLIYFFFSLEHKGVVGKASRIGIWVLMITFGAGFGYTVMGRIALLTNRFKYLLTDWLNLVPP